MSNRIRIAELRRVNESTRATNAQFGHNLLWAELHADTLTALLAATQAAHDLVADKPSFFLGIETQWKPLRDALERLDFGDER